ncbi:AAA domain-containing protein [Candidatus Methanarcanum hacksteinii]|uniref:AAA domain-containing protein n=1 Tax=Candidatus Methanarcanum hacksteinii TaxID=2911857 RepID=UPI0037DD683A
MDAKTIKEIGIRSCEDMLEQISHMQKGVDPRENSLVSMVVNDVKHIVRKENYIQIELIKGIKDLDNLGLSIENSKQKYFYSDNSSSEDYVIFDDYDESSRTVLAYPSDSLMKIINEHEDKDIKVIVDMKWLIELTKNCFERYGDRIGYPHSTPHFEAGVDYGFPAEGEPTEEQKQAVDTVLNNSLSYVWGAPGTGKTQYVLATSILAYVKKGKRVAIIAPTNNSVEQVLRGVLKVIEKDDPDNKYINPKQDILRMGAATAEFIHDYGDLCEDNAIVSKIKQLQRSNKIIESILFERSIDKLDANFDQIEALYEEEYDIAPFEKKKQIEAQIMDYWSEIKIIVGSHQELSGYVENIDEFNLRTRVSSIRSRLKERDRPSLEITHYKDSTDAELSLIIEDNNKRLAEYEKYGTGYRSKHVKIMAMTPFILMGRPSLFEEGGIVDVDHIFIDEAGYANLIQTMPVFMCGPPITMLGDHMQLPPVCEIDREKIITWATGEFNGYMKNGFMWDQSARFIESFLFDDIDNIRDQYVKDEEPSYKITALANLTKSHRFADSLAKILDKAVYKNGIRGREDTHLEVICYNVVGKNPETRMNPEEVEAVTEYIKKNKSTIGEFAVITPYRDQRKEIARRNRSVEDQILTIHGSQGREWKTVIISVADNRSSQREVPLRFTSSIPPNVGLKVMNTAVSRAKERLILFCDYEFWRDRAKMSDLLGMIVADSNTVVKYEI